jgi:16S rRNA (cytosine967-C5)-methyltransferase
VQHQLAKMQTTFERTHDNYNIVQKYRVDAEKQLEILQSFSHAVKDDGILLYSTCSLMPQENQHVVRAFLDQHPEFTPEALAPAFAENGVRIPALSNDAAMLTLTPAQHGTDGFFMARLRRKE